MVAQTSKEGSDAEAVTGESVENLVVDDPISWPRWQKIYHTAIAATFAFVVYVNNSLRPFYSYEISCLPSSSTVPLLHQSIFQLSRASDLNSKSPRQWPCFHIRFMPLDRG
jgi:hypothetical protein